MSTNPNRLIRFLKAIESWRLDGFLVSHPPNIRYLFGFSGSSGLAWIFKGEATLIVDSRYLEQARGECSNCRVELASSRLKEELAARWSSVTAGTRVGREATHLSVAEASRMDAVSSHLELVDCEQSVETLRLCKDESELQNIRGALEIAERSHTRLAARISEGLTEIEIAGQLEYELRLGGSEGLAFETIVASGPRSAEPHGLPSSRVPRPGEPILVDFGARLGGYVSDLTRMYLPESATAEVRSVSDAVWEAQERALDAVRPGASSRSVDQAARDTLQKYGWGDFFGHGTGHGIGLEIHEGPRISPLVDGELQPGMVFTVEPGVYLRGRFGVRMEDVVLVTESGHEILSRRRHSWTLPG